MENLARIEEQQKTIEATLRGMALGDPLAVHIRRKYRDLEKEKES